jgi:hypothetical protein
MYVLLLYNTHARRLSPDRAVVASHVQSISSYFRYSSLPFIPSRFALRARVIYMTQKDLFFFSSSASAATPPSPRVIVWDRARACVDLQQDAFSLSLSLTHSILFPARMFIVYNTRTRIIQHLFSHS